MRAVDADRHRHDRHEGRVPGRSLGSETRYASVTIHRDATAPSVVANADRAADAGGFYNHPLTATWTGVDATSGIASCTSTPYSGPDGTGLSLTGTCKDKAGNVSAAVPFVFNYDATPPVLTNVTVSPDDGGARLAWQASGAAKVMVMRSPAGARAAQADVVYDGTGAGFTDGNLSNGKRYTYLVQAIDAAGNTASDSASVTPSADASTKHLLSPGAASSLSRPPMLRWRRIARASYYNVQLFRNGKKILSAWPTRPRYQLHRVWAIRRPAPPAGQGHLSVAAVGRIRAPQRAPLRQAAGQAHVHRELKPGTIPAVRCLYVDLDGTLLGAGGAVTRDGEGRFTLLGVRALEACHRAGALVVAMSGRPRAVLGEDVRLLGMDEYVFEGGRRLRGRR